MCYANAIVVCDEGLTSLLSHSREKASAERYVMHRPIDLFFLSLAKDHHACAIAREDDGHFDLDTVIAEISLSEGAISKCRRPFNAVLDGQISPFSTS